MFVSQNNKTSMHWKWIIDHNCVSIVPTICNITALRSRTVRYITFVNVCMYMCAWVRMLDWLLFDSTSFDEWNNLLYTWIYLNFSAEDILDYNELSTETGNWNETLRVWDTLFTPTIICHTAEKRSVSDEYSFKTCLTDVNACDRKS